MSAAAPVTLELVDLDDDERRRKEDESLLPHQAKLLRAVQTLLSLRRTSPLFLWAPPGTGKTEVARQALLWVLRAGGKAAYVTPGHLVEQTLAKLAATAAGEAVPLRQTKRRRGEGVVRGEAPLLLAAADAGRDMSKAASLRPGGVAWLLASSANVHVLSKDVVPSSADFFRGYALVVLDEAHLCPGLATRLADHGETRGQLLAMSASPMSALRRPGRPPWLVLRLRPSARLEAACGFAQLKLSTARVACGSDEQLLRYWQEVLAAALPRKQSERALEVLEATWWLASAALSEARGAVLAATLRAAWQSLVPRAGFGDRLRFVAASSDERCAALRVAVASNPWAQLAQGTARPELRLPVTTLCALERAHRSAAHRPAQAKLERLLVGLTGAGRAGFSCLLVRVAEDAVRSTAAAIRDDARCSAVAVSTVETSQGRRRHQAVRRAVTWGGCRAALAVLRRAAARSDAPLARALRLGHGHVLREILGYVGGVRVLVTGSSLDVGYDLHHHVDGVCLAELPSTRADFEQQAGRLRRISRRPAAPVLVRCFVAAGTVEDALAHALLQEDDDEEKHEDGGEEEEEDDE